MTRGRDSNDAYIRTDHPDDNPHQIFAAAVGRDTTERAALDYSTESDPRTDEQRHEELTARVREVITSELGTDAGGGRPPVDEPQDEIDDGIDIGW